MTGLPGRNYHPSRPCNSIVNWSSWIRPSAHLSTRKNFIHSVSHLVFEADHENPRPYPAPIIYLNWAKWYWQFCRSHPSGYNYMLPLLSRTSSKIYVKYAGVQEMCTVFPKSKKSYKTSHCFVLAGQPRGSRPLQVFHGGSSAMEAHHTLEYYVHNVDKI